MKNILTLIVLALAGCSILEGASYNRGTPGYLDVKKPMPDGSRSVYLKPASLFDSDDSISIFRLGFYWETKMKDKVDFIIVVPIKWDAKHKYKNANVGGLVILKDNKKIQLKKSKNAITLGDKDLVIRKENYVKVRYQGNKKLLKSMLDAKDVVVQVKLADKMYTSRFDVNSKNRERYRTIRQNAFNGAGRFIEAINQSNSMRQ